VIRTGSSITPVWSALISVSPISLGDVLGASAMLMAASSARVAQRKAAIPSVPRKTEFQSSTARLTAASCVESAMGAT